MGLRNYSEQSIVGRVLAAEALRSYGPLNRSVFDKIPDSIQSPEQLDGMNREGFAIVDRISERQSPGGGPNYNFVVSYQGIFYIVAIEERLVIS